MESHLMSWQKPLKEIGKKVEFQNIDRDLKQTRVRNIDLIWNGYSITEECCKSRCCSLIHMENQVR